MEVAFIGAGNVLPAYLQVLDRLAARGLAREGLVCARDRTVWPALLARRPGLQLVADVEAVLASDADVVVVLTPPGVHTELAARALEHGQHVLVEKPFAESRAQGEALAQLAGERGLHLLAAPFVQLSPTFRRLWTIVQDGDLGHVHSARGLYGNPGAHWSAWYHTGGVGPLAELGVYNLKSLTALLGPVVAVQAADATAVRERSLAGEAVTKGLDADVAHVVLRHAGGALSTVTASQAIQHYRRPGLELYGTEGTAYLLGDDWDPRGLEVWRNARGSWELTDPVEPTWLWADGLRELVVALHEGRPPLAELEQDLHLLDVLAAAAAAARSGGTVAVTSTFAPLPLRLERVSGPHVHDHTRPVDEQ